MFLVVWVILASHSSSMCCVTWWLTCGPQTKSHVPCLHPRGWQNLMCWASQSIASYNYQLRKRVRQQAIWSLPKSSQKAMRTNLRHLKLLIIDEVSMVSSLNLAYIHLRLQELFGGDEWFGGRNILFVGDLLQLPPVNGAPIFECLSQ